MKLSILIGGVFAIPLAYMLMAQYMVEVPSDPQKGIGYGMIGLYSCFVWAMIALLVQGVLKAFSDKKSTAKYCLFSAAGGLAIAACIFWNAQLYQVRKRFLETTDQREALQRKTKEALVDKNFMALRAIAGNSNAPSDTLNEISKYDDFEVSRALAANPSSPEAVLEKLSKDKRYLVKMELLKNPSISGEILKEMLKDDDARIIKAARVKIEKCRVLAPLSP